ncbi:MAG TPA: hypothetical protein VKB49_27730 [Candidatus Sulfotelmatobacter sp.]|nr:hypothetical protein [Candidatus Sulfotelmatobacter sp.]
MATFRLTYCMQFVLLGLFTLSYPVVLLAQEPASLGIMPIPANVTQGEDRFVIDGSFGIALEGFREPRLERARQRFLDLLSRETGIPLWRQAVLNPPHFFARTGGPSATVQQLGEDESYHLEIGATNVILRLIPSAFCEGSKLSFN